MPDESQETQPSPALSETQPNQVSTTTQPNPGRPDSVKKFPRGLVALVVIILIILGILGGYESGMSQRYAAKNTQNGAQLQDQYQLGMQAMAAGNYDLADQYFKFVIKTDPNYPGIQASYSDLQIKKKVSPTPLFSQTPFLSPTPDMRGAQEIFNTAQNLLNSGNWDGALTNLDSLRKENPTYRTAEVDGMYYMALRQRGVAKITASCKDTNLEGGIYDLTLAEHFIGTGNLDSYSQSLRIYARFYIIGASFWDQDWTQAQYFFAQVMTGYPNMSDSSCQSATKRWYLATIKYAEQLTAAGDFCGAATQYASALNVNDPFNSTLQPTADAAQNQCGGGGNLAPTEGTLIPSETPTGGMTDTPTPTTPTP